MSEHDENEITDLDRQVADALAKKFDHEPDYESSATARRGMESALMYTEVYGLSAANGTALVTLDAHERCANKLGVMTPVVAAIIAEARRLAWANSDGPTMLNALMASNTAIHDERMKPENMERERWAQDDDD